MDELHAERATMIPPGTVATSDRTINLLLTPVSVFPTFHHKSSRKRERFAPWRERCSLIKRRARTAFLPCTMSYNRNRDRFTVVVLALESPTLGRLRLAACNQRVPRLDANANFYQRPSSFAKMPRCAPVSVSLPRGKFDDRHEM